MWSLRNLERVRCVFVDVNCRSSILLVVGLVIAGCTEGGASEIETTVASSTPAPGDTTTSTEDKTTSTIGVAEMESLTIDLLDGSELKVAGPGKLEFGGYFYFIEIPSRGEANVYLTRRADPVQAAAGENTEFHSDLGDGVMLWWETARAGRSS